MVCRECGAYNAEHLTHCRVCAAKLKDDAPAEPVKTEESGDRPARDFVAAPSWPKGAFSGAPENPPLKTPAAAPAAKAPAAAPAAARPLVQQPAEPATRRACPHCGKATLADAPYCAYCGELLNGPAKAAAPVMQPAKAAAPAPARRPAPRPARDDDFDDDDFDDDEFDDDEDEDDVKPAKKRGMFGRKPAKSDPDDEDDEFDEDEEDDDEYDEDYDEDYDELPKKRGKGTTFLFWGLIVLLIAVIAICGKVIADRNFDGDIGKMFSSIGSIFGGKEPVSSETPADGGDAAPSEAATMYTATITPYTDPTGSRYYDVNVIAPTGSRVQVVSSAALETSEAVVPDYDNVILRVAEAVFLPGEPCTSETITVTPNIQVITADGQTVPITVDPISVTVPVLSLTLEAPAETTVQATFNNDPIVITGAVDDPSTEDDHTVEVYINGEKVPVYDGGNFTYNYTPSIAPVVAAAATTATAATATTDPAAEATTAPVDPAGGIGETVAATAEAAAGTDDTTVSPEEAASDDTTVSPEEAASDDSAVIAAPAGSSTGESITIEARKNNCVTAKTVITVEPYVYQNMSLLVQNDAATGLAADTNGSLTLQGTVTPGAALTVSASSDKVSFGEPAVSATGNFTIAVTVSEVGAYNVTLTAKQEGFNETTTSTVVERAPSETYKKFKANASELPSILSKVTSGETTSGSVYFTGTVTEIVGTSPYTIFKVKLSDDTEVVCVNRSAKSKINSGDVKEKKQLFGSLCGFYNDTTTPYIWVWYILNK